MQLVRDRDPRKHARRQDDEVLHIWQGNRDYAWPRDKSKKGRAIARPIERLYDVFCSVRIQRVQM